MILRVDSGPLKRQAADRWRLRRAIGRNRMSEGDRQMAARIVVTEFVSLDGVMEAPGGEPDFKYPGWTFEFDRGEDGNQFKLDETRSADALLLGRRTYESFAGAWPQREGEFADKFNSMPKFVVSTTLKDPEWNNTTVLDSGDATSQVRELKEQFDGELQVPGSHRLVQELIASDLVDQLNLMVFPVILGTGNKAFEELPERRKLRLKESKVVGDGVLVLIYERGA
jgi:dihydrofolate reductase